MKKLFIVSILLVFSFVSCEDISAQSLTHHSIEGIWSIFPDVVEIGEEGFYRFNLSWGRRGFPRIIDIVVDLHSDPPMFHIPEFTESEIISINEMGNKTELTFIFWRGGFNVNAVFRFNEDGTMWVESYEGEDGEMFDPGRVGRDWVFHRIDGPVRDD